LSADKLGNVYVVAYTYGSAVGTSAGLADGVLAKYDEAGNLQWAKQFGTSGYDFAFSVSADLLGNVFVSGGYYATQDAWNSGNQDTFLTKFDALGNQQWNRLWATTGNDQSTTPSPDNAGNVYLVSSSQGALGGPSHGGFDIAFGKYNSNGDLLWIEQLGTSGNDVGSLKADGAGNLYGIGRTDASWGGPNAGGNDVVVLKLSTPPMAAAVTAPAALSAVASPLIPATSNSDASHSSRSEVAREHAYASLGSLRHQVLDNLSFAQTDSGPGHNLAKLPSRAKPGVAVTTPTLDAAFAAIIG
jgi:hypothetical protein